MTPPKQTLSVYCNQKDKFPNFGSMTGEDGSSRRFVGWIEVANGEWQPNPEPEQLNSCAEYRRAVASGELIPADQATASLCGIPFPKQSKPSAS